MAKCWQTVSGVIYNTAYKEWCEISPDSTTDEAPIYLYHITNHHFDAQGKGKAYKFFHKWGGGK